jgi:hypothetical protein
MVHQKAMRPNRDRKIRLTYDIELLPLKGEPSHLMVDGLNGTAWKADGRSGSILDAVSVAECGVGCRNVTLGTARMLTYPSRRSKS